MTTFCYLESHLIEKKESESFLNAHLFTSYINKTDTRNKNNFKNNCNIKKKISLVQHHVYNISQ